MIAKRMGFIVTVGAVLALALSANMVEGQTAADKAKKPDANSQTRIKGTQKETAVGTDLGFGSTFDRLVSSARGPRSRPVDETVYLSSLFS